MQFSSILGSGFHRAHRITTPAKHKFKKLYSVAVSEAAYEWDLDSMMEVYHCVKEHINITFEQFKVWRYYRRDYFMQRVKRVCPPPPQLYERMRTVFLMFGPKIDSVSKKPLFNNDCWTKANTIKRGFY